APVWLVSSMVDVGDRLLLAYRDGSYEATSAAIYQPGASALTDVHPLLSVPHGEAVGAGVVSSPNREHHVAIIVVADPEGDPVPGAMYAERWTAASGWSQRFQL